MTDQDQRKFKTVSDVPGPYSLPILGTRWIFSSVGSYTLNKIHDAYKGKNSLTLMQQLRKQVVPGSIRITTRRFVHFNATRFFLDSRIDLNQRYGALCKEEALWNFPVISVFSRQDIEAVIRRSPRYPLRPPQEVISHYRRNRHDRYTNLGLVNE